MIDAMELSHYSLKPITVIRDGEPQVPVHSSYEKPRGFWVSVDGENDWKEWCEDEDFGDIDKCLRYRINLAPDANILRVSQDMGLLHFEQKYGVFNDYGDVAIDWPRVATEYDGIIITPYHWVHRLTSNWYYTWDCASGCIWKAKAIHSFELVSSLALELSGNVRA